MKTIKEEEKRERLLKRMRDYSKLWYKKNREKKLEYSKKYTEIMK